MASPNNSNALQVIVHADDLGISPQVNDAIFSLMEQGVITSASLLTNGPAFGDAVHRACSYPQCSFGVHLNITEFQPLSAQAGLAPLLSPQGEFRRLHGDFLFASALKAAITLEWASQVQRARDAGLKISHVDSHHHAHTRFGLLQCLSEVCEQHAIRRVRLRQTLFPAEAPLLWRPDNALYNRALRHRFTCTDEFGPFGAFAANQDRLQGGSRVELMIHPGHPSYVSELQALQRQMAQGFRDTHQCISYLDLN